MPPRLPAAGPLTRTEVCITVDVEFSIASAFEAPDRYAPIAEAAVDGSTPGREEGLGFILGCLKRHGIQGTFFVEALNRAYFGDEPMKRVVRRILDAGQDVQLHLHPVWRVLGDPQWRTLLSTRKPSDSLVGRPPEESAGLLRLGIETLVRWGAVQPVALRMGNLQADANTYVSMHEVGLRLASNLGIGHSAPGEPELSVRAGARRIRGVLEMPVLTYSDWHGDRILTVTGTGTAETQSILWAARRAGLATVVVLTHPSEFFKTRGKQYEKTRPNRVNQNRLERLCRFLRENDRDFVSRSFGEAAQEWLARGEAEGPMIRSCLWHSVSRRLQNKVNDTIWLY